MDAAQTHLPARAVDPVLVDVAHLQGDQDAGDHDHQLDDGRQPVMVAQPLGEPAHGIPQARSRVGALSLFPVQTEGYRPCARRFKPQPVHPRSRRFRTTVSAIEATMLKRQPDVRILTGMDQAGKGGVQSSSRHGPGHAKSDASRSYPATKV